MPQKNDQKNETNQTPATKQPGNIKREEAQGHHTKENREQTLPPTGKGRTTTDRSDTDRDRPARDPGR